MKWLQCLRTEKAIMQAEMSQHIQSIHCRCRYGLLKFPRSLKKMLLRFNCICILFANLFSFSPPHYPTSMKQPNDSALYFCFVLHGNTQLVCTYVSRKKIIVIWAFFWQSLTQNQPICFNFQHYLRSKSRPLYSPT